MNSQIQRIREYLEGVRREQFNKSMEGLKDEDAHQLLGLLGVTEANGARKLAERVLEMLPQEEHDAVRHARCLNEMVKEESDPEKERVLYALRNEKEQEAREVISRRIVKEKRDHGVVLIDSVTNVQSVIAGGEDLSDMQTEMHEQSIVNAVIQGKL